MGTSTNDSAPRTNSSLPNCAVRSCSIARSSSVPRGIVPNRKTLSSPLGLVEVMPRLYWNEAQRGPPPEPPARGAQSSRSSISKLTRVLRSRSTRRIPITEAGVPLPPSAGNPSSERQSADSATIRDVAP
jgi:hypothetical protein